MLTISGCTTMSTVLPAIGKKTQDAADQALAVNVFTFCGQPYSSIQRNRGEYPGLVASIEALCGAL
jgi:hypothetical protein|tara:strand:+ start:3241 stop:3438 length:198 start_codon:yes stop_codon:yes gene_type:complete